MLIKYAVLETKWGFFGIAGTDKFLLRTHLPAESRKIVEKQLLKNFEKTSRQPKYRLSLQKRIKAYFEGKNPDDFTDILTEIRLIGTFSTKVLTACRKIKAGKTISYSRLARLAGYPKAARAVGSALAKNPLPLIIPCHRVIRSDGNLGGFTAAGRTTTKQKLLKLEQAFKNNPKIVRIQSKDR